MHRSFGRWISIGMISLAGCRSANLTQQPNATVSQTSAKNPIVRLESSSIAQRDLDVGPLQKTGDGSAGSSVVPASANIVFATPSINLENSSLGSSAEVEPQTTQDGQNGASNSSASGASSDSAMVLDFASVLSLADAQNPNVALARERILEAYARVDRATALWIPSLRSGINYNHHDGAIQDVAGTVFNTSRSSLYGGLGAAAIGAGSPAVPGLIAQFHLSDALTQPKIASHQAASRQFAATAVRNDTLRDASVAYWELVRAERWLAITIDIEARSKELMEITKRSSEVGQGLQSDFERMSTELSFRRDEVLSAQEGVQVASARLGQLLHLPHAQSLGTGEPAVAALEILETEQTEADYVAAGLLRRPELAEQKHLVCEAVERMRREKIAPLVPSVLLGVSYGGLGGGLGSSIVNTGDRFDADAIAYWELRNLGFGEKAVRSEQASLVRQSQVRKVAALDQVAREVSEAYAQVQSRKQRVENSKVAIAAAEKSYELNRERILNAQGLPIEALQSIVALQAARRAYLNAVVDFNVAQVNLCRATGWFMQG